MRRTVLYEAHKALNAQFVEFAGWEMPISYYGVLEEHKAVRTAAGLFDVSHMGRIQVDGQGAKRFLQNLSIIDLGDSIAQIAIQGPKSLEIMQKLTDVDLSTVKLKYFVEGRLGGMDA